MIFWIYCFCATSLLLLINPLIEISFGGDYLFPMSIVTLIIIDFVISGLSNGIETMRTSNGIFIKGRYRPLIMAFLNLILSIILGKFLGIRGIILGTILSKVFTILWFDPYLIFKILFNKRPFSYYIKYIVYLIIIAFCCGLSYIISSFILIDSKYLLFFIKAIICIIVPNFIVIILFHKSEEFKYLIEKFKHVLIKLKNII